MSVVRCVGLTRFCEQFNGAHVCQANEFILLISNATSKYWQWQITTSYLWTIFCSAVPCSILPPFKGYYSFYKDIRGNINTYNEGFFFYIDTWWIRLFKVTFPCFELASIPLGECISVNNSLSIITGVETWCWNYQGHRYGPLPLFPLWLL